MGLNFGGNLFNGGDRTIIWDEDGTEANVTGGVISTSTDIDATTQAASVLKERWQQTGSTLVNADSNIGTQSTLYTVTATKTLYVKQMIISVDELQPANSEFTLDDNGTDKMSISLVGVAAGTTMVLNFVAPLEFDTDIGNDGVADVDGNVYVTILGWEE